MSIARRHKERVLAAIAEGKETKKNAVASAKPMTPAAKNKIRHDYDVVVSAMESDLVRLSEISDISEKIKLKLELLPKYKKFIDDYIERGERYPNAVLVYYIVWLFDVGNIEEALRLASVAIEQKQLTPDKYKRDLPTLVTDLVCDWAEACYQKQESAKPYFDQVLENLISEKWVVSQVVVHSKCYRLAGMIAERNQEWAEAVKWFEKTMAVNPEGHGVKTRHAKAVKHLENT